jgi:hypothetical protein
MFGHARNQLVHLAPGAEDTRQQMAICYASSSDKYTLLLEIRKTSGSCVEPSAQSFWAEGSDKRPSTQHLRPKIQPIYQGRATTLYGAVDSCGAGIACGVGIEAG